MSTETLSVDGGGDAMQSQVHVPAYFRTIPSAPPAKSEASNEMNLSSSADDRQQTPLSQPTVPDAPSPAHLEVSEQLGTHGPDTQLYDTSVVEMPGSTPESSKGAETIHPPKDIAPRDTQHNCTYACQPQKPTGWAAVEKTLTDYDRQEIEGHKEDIDSLLTFAGLYSAVLTAFVIVSFTQLQEDTATESLRVLRIIANQTADSTVVGGNSPTITFADSPPFQPSLAAIRVNVLWFASLVLSLSTASFAILVKQWLRAYMAITSSSPQGQLRIRHFRRSGLDTWRVLGIASMLPLLLQVSLILFFVGLCFFTSDIHPAIGNTTVPLVCAWAFLFTTVTLSPAFSARCPYKTLALTPITSVLRTRVYVLGIRPWLAPAAVFVARCISHYTMLCFAMFWDEVIIPMRGLSPEKVNMYLATHDLFAPIVLTTSREEKDVLADGANDALILASADSLQANPELDYGAMDVALYHTEPHWTEAIKFLVRVIGNRIPLPSDFSEGPAGIVIDLKPIQADTIKAIENLFLRHVEPRLPIESNDPSSYSTAGAWLISVLFAIYGYDALSWSSFPPNSRSYVPQWLGAQCRPPADHARDPQLLLWVCSYIVGRTDDREGQSDTLPGDLKMLEYAMAISANHSLSTVCCGQSEATFGTLAARAAQRLLKGSKYLYLQRQDWTALKQYSETVSIASRLHWILRTTQYSKKEEEERLLGGRLREIVPQYPIQACIQLEELVSIWISLPPTYVSEYVATLVRDAPYGEHEYASFARAINAVAEITEKRSFSRILNLGLIALCLTEGHIRCLLSTDSDRRVPLSSTDSPIQTISSAWSRPFLFIASALANVPGKTGLKFKYRTNIRLGQDILEIGKNCKVRIERIHSLRSSPDGEKYFTVPAYFCLELEYVNSGFSLDLAPTSRVPLLPWEMMRTKKRQEERLRWEGERAINQETRSFLRYMFAGYASAGSGRSLPSKFGE